MPERLFSSKERGSSFQDFAAVWMVRNYSSYPFICRIFNASGQVDSFA